MYKEQHQKEIKKLCDLKHLIKKLGIKIEEYENKELNPLEEIELLEMKIKKEDLSMRYRNNKEKIRFRSEFNDFMLSKLNLKDVITPSTERSIEIYRLNQKSKMKIEMLKEELNIKKHTVQKTLHI